MKPYLDLLRDIVENGVDCPDRTGTGRRRVFGRQIRFSLKDGKLPLVTTRKVFTRGMIEETLWFIKGQSNANLLSESGVKIWDDWKVEKEDVRQWLLERGVIPADSNEEYIEELIKNNFQSALGEIGPIYGPNWRRWQRNMDRWMASRAPTSHLVRSLASDHAAQFDKEYQNYLDLTQKQIDMMKQLPEEQRPQIDPRVLTQEQFNGELSKTFIDQMQELIEGLKARPYSARHIVTSWNPDHIPTEGVSPEMNVMDGFGALAPCHVLQQYYVLPPEVEGGKPRISLLMFQRSCDVPVGAPFNIAQYCVMLRMVAQVVGMEAHEFVYTIGDAHIYFDQVELVKEQIERAPRELPTLWLNPTITDLFDFKAEDIKIVGYDPDDGIKYPISK